MDGSGKLILTMSAVGDGDGCRRTSCTTVSARVLSVLCDSVAGSLAQRAVVDMLKSAQDHARGERGR